LVKEDGMEIIGIERTLERAETGAVLTYRAKPHDQPELAAASGGGALVFEAWRYADLLDLAEADEEWRAAFADPRAIAVQPGGWLSWSAGWELDARDRPPPKPLLPALARLTDRDGATPSGRETVGHFVMYLRSGERYLFVASLEDGSTPPVSYRLDRRTGWIAAEAYAPGQVWADGAIVARLVVGASAGPFGLKDALKAVYRPEAAFARVAFLSAPRGGGADAAGAGGRAGGDATWYNHYTAIDEAVVRADLAAVSRTPNLLKRYFVDRGRTMVFQIDDGWQRAVGDWEADAGRFPAGLAPLAADIAAAGHLPGLWLAPFLVTRRARLFREKPEWLLRGRGGRAVVAGLNDKWGGFYYCLDLSRPEVLAYLGGLVDRAIDQWGFRYLKLDFLYAGLLDGAFAAPGEAGYRHYERAVAALTARKADAAGRPVAYLGCGQPLGPSYRHLPLSRIGADTCEAWDRKLLKLLGLAGRPSAWINLRDTIGRNYLDGSVYLADPDVVFLRSAKCRLTPTEQELIGLVAFLLGSQLMCSDTPDPSDPAAAARAKRLVGLYDALAGDEYAARRLDRDVHRLDSRSGRTVGLINLGDRPWRLAARASPDLAEAFARRPPLVDHRLSFGSGRDAVFAARSITLMGL
jgi:alpha-galactosidase